MRQSRASCGAVPAAFRMKLAPYAKVALTNRGNLRVGLGPRAARVYAGTGSRASFSSGYGPFQYWSRSRPYRSRRHQQVVTGDGRQAVAATTGPSVRAVAKGKGEAVVLNLALSAGAAVASAAYDDLKGVIRRRRDKREEKAFLIETLEEALVSAHLQEFAPTAPPVWEEP